METNGKVKNIIIQTRESNNCKYAQVKKKIVEIKTFLYTAQADKNIEQLVTREKRSKILVRHHL